MEEIKNKLSSCCRMLYMEGLMDHAGLVSARIPESDTIILNPRTMLGTKGRHPGLIEPKDLVVVNLKGEKIEGENDPPSETPIFTNIFKSRSDVMAAFHLHLPFATLFSIAGKRLFPVYTLGAVFGEKIPLYPDSNLIQTDFQGKRLAKVIGQSRAVLLKGHGAVIVGEDIESTFVGTIFFEDNAKKLFMCSMIGSPKPLNKKEIEAASKTTWNRKVIDKVWAYYELKAKLEGVIEA